MKLTVQHYHLRSRDTVDSLIENRILALQSRMQIDEANVRLECRYQESPAFCVRVHLVTPGPDVIVEHRDHTIRAAIAKVMAAVEAKLSGRDQKRRRRLRGNAQEPALPHMRTGAGTLRATPAGGGKDGGLRASSRATVPRR